MSDLRAALESFVRTLSLRAGENVGVNIVVEKLAAILELYPAHPDDITPEDVEALRPIVDKQRREKFALKVIENVNLVEMYNRAANRGVSSDDAFRSTGAAVVKIADAILAELDKGES